MNKTAVLFIHGFPFDHSMWRHQLQGLSKWRCLAPDLRGAGGSEPIADASQYSIARYAGDLIALLDQHRVDPVIVCGLSMGGYIAFELMRQIPARVRALILCNTKSAADTAEARRGRDALAEKARTRGAAAVAEELMPKLLAQRTRQGQPAIVREVKDLIERQPVAGIVGALHALRERPDSTPLLATIRVPTLVIAGDDDQITPAAGMREMASAIADARFEVITDAGHLTPLEQPAVVNETVTSFLERVS